MILALGSAVYVFTINGLSARLDINYARSLIQPKNGHQNFKYAIGTFDVESWACGVKDLPGFDEDGVAGMTCSLEMGARFLTIFVFMFSSGLFALFLLDWRGEKLMVRTWKNRRASWRNDYI